MTKIFSVSCKNPFDAKTGPRRRCPVGCVDTRRRFAWRRIFGLVERFAKFCYPVDLALKSKIWITYLENALINHVFEILGLFINQFHAASAWASKFLLLWHLRRYKFRIRQSNMH
jgi:hypothetical protein